MLFDDRSKLKTDGGLPPDRDRDDPRAGGGAGSETVDGDVNGVCEDPLAAPGRREGGGGGALILSVDGLLFSCIGILGSSSSGFGDNLAELLLVSFDSDTIWLCRRARGGAGGFFLRMDEDGDGGSGVFPADSLSKTDSRSDS